MRKIFELLNAHHSILPPRRKGRKTDHPLTFRFAFPLRRLWPELSLRAGVILSG
jgi:hypothetical protein